MPAYIITVHKGPVCDPEAMAEYQRGTREMKKEPQTGPRVIDGETEGRWF